MKKLSWEPLKKGDIVDVVAPAGRPKPHTISGIEGFLNSWGLKARVAPDILQKNLFCSNSRENRWRFLKQALMAKDSKMIWCLRGGYGSLHLLDDLRKLKPQKAKCFLGYSDITSLHTFINQNWGWSTLHGCNIDRFALGTGTKAEERRLFDVVFARKTELEYKLTPLNELARKKAVIPSVVVGGNLITLQSSFGTSYQLQTRGKILFLEEIGERAYKVDRVLEHMRQLGMLMGLKGLVLGQFTEGLEPNGKNIFNQFFKQFAKEQKFPVLMGLPCGHGKNQHPLPFNTKSSLVTGINPRLRVSAGASCP